MRISEWIIETAEPLLENEWAFIEEFATKNPIVYNQQFDAGLSLFWREVVDIYNRLAKSKKIDWLPADFYFSFFAHKSSWSFALNLKSSNIRSTAFYCLRDPYAPSSQHITMHPRQVECYLSSIALEDRYALAKIFHDKKYKVTGNYLSIEL